MEEKHVWRILAVSLLLCSVAYGQISAEKKAELTEQIKDYIKVIDKKSSTSEMEQTQIADENIKKLENTVNDFEKKKCLDTCRVCVVSCNKIK